MSRGPAAALLYIANGTVDLGVLPPCEVREIAFPVVNKGDRRLVINETDRECRCGERRRRTILISPGDTAEVIVSVDTRFATGAIDKSTSFTTNDPTQPRFDLTVRARVHADEQIHGSDADERKQMSVLIPRQQ